MLCFMCINYLGCKVQSAGIVHTEEIRETDRAPWTFSSCTNIICKHHVAESSAHPSDLFRSAESASFHIRL